MPTIRLKFCEELLQECHQLSDVKSSISESHIPHRKNFKPESSHQSKITLDVETESYKGTVTLYANNDPLFR